MIKFLSSSSAVSTLSRARYRACNSAENIVVVLVVVAVVVVVVVVAVVVLVVVVLVVVVLVVVEVITTHRGSITSTRAVAGASTRPLIKKFTYLSPGSAPVNRDKPKYMRLFTKLKREK